MCSNIKIWPCPLSFRVWFFNPLSKYRIHLQGIYSYQYEYIPALKSLRRIGLSSIIIAEDNDDAVGAGDFSSRWSTFDFVP